MVSDGLSAGWGDPTLDGVHYKRLPGDPFPACCCLFFCPPCTIVAHQGCAGDATVNWVVTAISCFTQLWFLCLPQLHAFCCWKPVLYPLHGVEISKAFREIQVKKQAQEGYAYQAGELDPTRRGSKAGSRSPSPAHRTSRSTPRSSRQADGPSAPPNPDERPMDGPGKMQRVVTARRESQGKVNLCGEDPQLHGTPRSRSRSQGGSPARGSRGSRGGSPHPDGASPRRRSSARSGSTQPSEIVERLQAGFAKEESPRAAES